MEQNDFLPHSTSVEGGHMREGSPGLPPCGELLSRQDLPLNESHDHSCGCCAGHEGCGPDSWGLSEYPLAMVYAPCQAFRALYDTDTALHRGTLFTELDLPLGGESGFNANGCACRRERRRT